MRTERSRPPVLGRPRAQDAPHAAEESGQVGSSLFKEPAHGGAGGGTGAGGPHNVSDLGQGQPQPAAMLNELQDVNHFAGIDAVAGRGPARTWENPPGLVQPHCLVAGSAASGDLADEK